VCLRTADDDTIGAPLYDAEVEIRVLLFVGSPHPVALHVGLRAHGREIFTLYTLHEVDEVLIVLRAVLLVCVVRDHGERVHGVDAHAALDAAADLLAVQAGHLLLVEQVFLALMDVVEAVDSETPDQMRSRTSSPLH